MIRWAGTGGAIARRNSKRPRAAWCMLSSDRDFTRMREANAALAASSVAH